MKSCNFIFLFLIIFLLPDNLLAHKVYVFAWAENGQIFTESKFSSKKAVNKGKISVYDDKGKILVQGITSENGEFSFGITENMQSDIVIQLEAGMGHKAEWNLMADDIQMAKRGGDNKELAQKQKADQIKQPSLIKIASGILIIFTFFIIAAYLKKRKINNK
jgi:nickel transport protein